jgi:hypothetical protein
VSLILQQIAAQMHGGVQLDNIVGELETMKQGIESVQREIETAQERLNTVQRGVDLTHDVVLQDADNSTFDVQACNDKMNQPFFRCVEPTQTCTRGPLQHGPRAGGMPGRHPRSILV